MLADDNNDILILILKHRAELSVSIILVFLARLNNFAQLL